MAISLLSFFLISLMNWGNIEADVRIPEMMPIIFSTLFVCYPLHANAIPYLPDCIYVLREAIEMVHQLDCYLDAEGFYYLFLFASSQALAGFNARTR